MLYQLSYRACPTREPLQLLKIVTVNRETRMHSCSVTLDPVKNYPWENSRVQDYVKNVIVCVGPSFHRHVTYICIHVQPRASILVMFLEVRIISDLQVPCFFASWNRSGWHVFVLFVCAFVCLFFFRPATLPVQDGSCYIWVERQTLSLLSYVPERVHVQFLNKYGLTVTVLTIAMQCWQPNGDTSFSERYRACLTVFNCVKQKKVTWRRKEMPVQHKTLTSQWSVSIDLLWAPLSLSL